MFRCDRIGHESVAKPQIQCEVPPDFPIVLNVSGQIEFAEVAISVALGGQRTKEQKRPSCQEIRYGIKVVLAAEPTGRIHVRLHALDDASELHVVIAESPINVVAGGELVLNEQERKEDARPQWRDASGDRQSAV